MAELASVALTVRVCAPARQGTCVCHVCVRCQRSTLAGVCVCRVVRAGVRDKAWPSGRYSVRGRAGVSHVRVSCACDVYAVQEPMIAGCGLAGGHISRRVWMCAFLYRGRVWAGALRRVIAPIRRRVKEGVYVLAHATRNGACKIPYRAGAGAYRNPSRMCACATRNREIAPICAGAHAGAYRNGSLAIALRVREGN
jgi:hypothetical protein